ncbi:MAG: hypothetical protein DLM50_01180 [Candidatus Meridianibacter frigidus]|nr:MAG: hypothetical protein DLM50_01180 [Candidatus Eremiobacteraeota bacterium]
MKIAALIARILLGLIFFVFGLNGFLFFIPAPPMTGFPQQFLAVIMASHFILFVSGVEVIAGAMLLTNQYVPLAIVVLAAVLSNILVYHITMQLSGIPLALVATVLWFVVAWPLRAHFAPLFARKAEQEA